MTAKELIQSFKRIDAWSAKKKSGLTMTKTDLAEYSKVEQQAETKKSTVLSEYYQAKSKEEVMTLVASNMKLKITDCTVASYWETGGTGCKEDYINKSYISGDEVILGIYDNPEFRLISFFHEVGHIASHKLFSGHDEYADEKMAWEVGFMIAASHGVFFSESAENFANENLESYKKQKL